MRARTSRRRTAPGLRVERALPLWSERLGLIGKADVVEFLPDGSPYPIEYKHGNRNKKPPSPPATTCSWPGRPLPGRDERASGTRRCALLRRLKRRRTVSIGPALRERVDRPLARSGRMLATRHTPPPVNDERCRACSLRDLCQPDALTRFVAERRDLFDPDA